MTPLCATCLRAVLPKYDEEAKVWRFYENSAPHVCAGKKP